MSSIWHETKTRPPRMLDFTTQEDIDLNRHTKGLSNEVYISYMSHEEYISGLGEVLNDILEAEVTIPFDGPIKWRSLHYGYDNPSKDIATPTYWRKKK